MWDHVSAGYTERSILENPLSAVGHEVAVRDDLPADGLRPGDDREKSRLGRATVLVDGQIAGATALAEIRPARTDLGRYHLWINAWAFVPAGTADTMVLLARRLRPDSLHPERYELIMLRRGSVERRVLMMGQLTESWPAFRGTQLVRSALDTDRPLPISILHALLRQPFPLSVLEGAAFPPLLLLFPLGPLVLGALMLRAAHRRAA